MDNSLVAREFLIVPFFMTDCIDSFLQTAVFLGGISVSGCAFTWKTFLTLILSENLGKRKILTSFAADWSDWSPRSCKV